MLHVSVQNFYYQDFCCFVILLVPVPTFPRSIIFCQIIHNYRILHEIHVHVCKSSFQVIPSHKNEDFCFYDIYYLTAFLFSEGPRYVTRSYSTKQISFYFSLYCPNIIYFWKHSVVKTSRIDFESNFERHDIADSNLDNDD